MKLKHVVPAVVPTLCTACMPLVHHGPWIRDRVSADASISAIRADDTGGEAGFGFALDGGIRYGHIIDDSTKSGVSAGVQMPLTAILAFGEMESPGDLLSVLSGDVYFAGSRARPYAKSAGIQFSRFHFMPYVQIGSPAPESGSWYTTQSILFGRDDSDLVMWVPSITMIEGGEHGGASHLTFSAGWGREREETRWFLALTVEFELFHAESKKE